MKNFVLLTLMFLSIAVFANAQAGRRTNLNAEGTILSVFAVRDKNPSEQINFANIALYDNGIEQKINKFTFDPSPARIVLLVDNSQTLPTEVAKLQNSVKEFSYEIFDGDQLYVAAYDEKPEIIQEWTDDAKKIETSLQTFRKKGNPALFDSLNAILEEVLRPIGLGTRKTAVVVISDGLDRSSKTKFDNTLAELQKANVTVYALQIPDRTGGAFRRDQPKPEQVLTKLTEGTGGKIFDFAEPQIAAKAICDELRKNRYLLSYLPSNTSSYDARRLLIVGDEGITFRSKSSQPPNVK
ncbi:MAG: VWA domain-containing protein [Pyrinomonadaceae bacterium]|nr:VWA domain-containing protein [Pyrinomonadaceae bacterium]